MIAGTAWSLLWKWPHVTGDRWIDGVRGALDEDPPGRLAGLMVEGAGAALAARRRFPGIPLHGGPGLNAWNARAVRTLAPMFRSITLSPELSFADLRELLSRLVPIRDSPSLGFLVEGNLEVMVSEDRLAGLLPGGRRGEPGREFLGIRDGTSRIFPIGTDICGRTRVSNSIETCLVDRLPDLVSLGVGHLLIDARARGPRYAREMAAIYWEALSLTREGGKGIARRLGELREECRRRAMGGITHGALLRGLREEEGYGE